MDGVDDSKKTVSAVPSKMPFLSERAEEYVRNSEFMDKFLEVLGNQFAVQSNPQGIVSLGIAENSLMYKEFTEYVNSNLKISAFVCSYGDGGNGSKVLTAALANLFNTRFKSFRPVQSADIVVSAGASATSEMFSYVLANPGDGFLIGMPYYGAFNNDFSCRAKAVPVKVAFEGSDPFGASAVDYYENALERFNDNPTGAKIRALILINPHNPLGRCYSKETLKALLLFCQKHEIHCVSDEIYALSVFENPEAPDAAPFTSVLSLDLTGIIDPSLVHVIYGMSKDFGANGFRLGAFVSQSNAHIIKAMRTISIFSWPSAVADKCWATILGDSKFLQYYVDENSRRLSGAYQRTTEFLRANKIKYHKDINAGVFVWIDLSEFLAPAESGVSPIESERQLAGKFLKAGIFLATGGEFSSEVPGYFRLVFSHEREVVHEGLQRMMGVLRGG